MTARNLTQPSSSSSFADRSVVSGLISEPPSNGSLRSVHGEVSFAVAACATACWRAPRVRSFSPGLSRFSRIRE